jgi:hypothetical protein
MNEKANRNDWNLKGVDIGVIPPTWGGHNSLASCSFLPILRAIDAPEGLHLLFGHHKQWGLRAKTANKPPLSDHSWAVLPYILKTKNMFTIVWHNFAQFWALMMRGIYTLQISIEIS